MSVLFITFKFVTHSGIAMKQIATVCYVQLCASTASRNDVNLKWQFFYIAISDL